MALTLMQNFKSSLDLNQIKTVIKDKDFQEKRNKEIKLISYEIFPEPPSKITIKKVLEIELPTNISALVTNPFEIIEIWNLDKENEILVTIDIPKIQTLILVEVSKSEDAEILIKSEIKSKVFMMGSFVEEHVAKFWKKLIDKDLKLLTEWPINQI